MTEAMNKVVFVMGSSVPMATAASQRRTIATAPMNTGMHPGVSTAMTKAMRSLRTVALMDSPCTTESAAASSRRRRRARHTTSATPHQPRQGLDAPDEVRTKLQDLINLRREKILQGLKNVDVETMSLDITNLSRVEIECVRQQSLSVMDKMVGALRTIHTDEGEATQTGPDTRSVARVATACPSFRARALRPHVF